MRAASMRLDQRDRLGPRHDLIDLIEEDFLARLLGQRIEGGVIWSMVDIFADPRVTRAS